MNKISEIPEQEHLFRKTRQSRRPPIRGAAGSAVRCEVSYRIMGGQQYGTSCSRQLPSRMICGATDCEEHTYQIRESELMSDTVEPWWNDGTTEEDREIITGLNPENFSPKDDRKAFRDACDMWWNGRTNDEKIRLWRQATAPEEE